MQVQSVVLVQVVLVCVDIGYGGVFGLGLVGVCVLGEVVVTLHGLL